MVSPTGAVEQQSHITPNTRRKHFERFLANLKGMATKQRTKNQEIQWKDGAECLLDLEQTDSLNTKQRITPPQSRSPMDLFRNGLKIKLPPKKIRTDGHPMHFRYQIKQLETPESSSDDIHPMSSAITETTHNSPTVQQSTAATAHPSAFCSCCRENGCIAAADAQAKFDEFEKRIEARFQSWEMQQDTFREYQTIQLGDRYGEAISRLQEDNQNLEWALRSQYREFQELQEREKRLVSEVDELKEQLKQYQRADEEDRKMSLYEELYPEAYAELRLHTQTDKDWKRRTDAKVRPFRNWIASSAEEKHRPPRIKSDITYSGLPDLTKTAPPVSDGKLPDAGFAAGDLASQQDSSKKRRAYPTPPERPHLELPNDKPSQKRRRNEYDSQTDVQSHDRGRAQIRENRWSKRRRDTRRSEESNDRGYGGSRSHKPQNPYRAPGNYEFDRQQSHEFF